MDNDRQQPGALSRRAVLTAAVAGSAAAFAGLNARPARAATSLPLSPHASLTATGVDYSWGRPDPGVTAGLGYTFVCRYLSYDTSGKNLTAGEAQALIAAGLDIVLVWEDSPTGALAGYAAGAQNARDAQNMALACGMPAGRPIYFAVDFDATPGQQAAIDSYFDGAASVLGYGRTGAYGGYYPVQRLFDAGKITWGWQTYAWSGGQWESRAQLRQVQNGITVDGADCDQDEAWAADYGQWGARAAARQSQVVAIGGQGGTQSQVAAIGLDGAIYHDIRAANGNWQGWYPLSGYDGAAKFNAGVVDIATLATGTSQLVATGIDGNIYHDIRAASGVWQGWKPLGGYDGAPTFTASAVSITGMSDGSSQLVATGIDSNTYHNIRAASGVWQGWKQLTGANGASTFAAGALSITGVPNGSGTSQLAATGNDGNIYHTIRSATGTWQSWQPVGGYSGAATFNAGALSITGFANGSTQIVATGIDGDIYHNTRAANGVWAGWEPLDGANGASRFNATAVSLTGMSDGSSQLVAVGLDDSVYHDIRYSGGVWQGWRAMAGYDGAGAFQCA